MAVKLWNVNLNNAFGTTLDGNIDIDSDTITLTMVIGLQAPGILVIDRNNGSFNTPTLREYISYTGLSGHDITGVTRALGGSTAQPHNSGAMVEEVLTVDHWNDLIEFLQVAHDASGNLNAGTALTTVPTSDHTTSGVTVQFAATTTMNFGDVGYIASTGKVTLIDADVIASMSGIAMCADTQIAADETGNFLLMGIARDDTWNWTVGGIIYGTVTGTSGNTLSQTAPIGTDDVVQIIGVATHADRMFFNPQLTQVELT